jgi:hypothetical protein
MEEAHFIFTSDPLELKSEGENFFVEGYISTSDLDLVNDIVTKACLLDMAEQMKSRNIKFDVEHESFRGNSNLEREANKTIIPAAKMDDFLMDKKGIKVRAKLNNHSARFNEVKGSIQDGFLDAFSIAYIPIKSTIEERKGEKVRLLDKIHLLNIAFTGNPVNTAAKMTNVFAKSLEFLKEQEDHNHVGDNLIKLQEVKNMSGEEIKEKVDEVKEVTATEPKAKEGPMMDEETDEEKKKRLQKEKESEKKDEELAEVKSRLEQTEKELAEVKALLKKPVLKSKVEQKDKSDNFEEKKSLNPLDLIA